MEITNQAAPTFSIDRFVEEVHALDPEPGQAVDRLPDGRTRLGFRQLEGGLGDVYVIGPHTRAHFKTAHAVVRAVVVQFKPGWSTAIFGVPASELTDRFVPLDALWGRDGDDLTRELLAASSVPEIVARMTRAIERRVGHATEPASSLLARRAVRLLEGDSVRVESVAERLGVSARHLRRAFTESVGVGPKEYARAVRLQRAVRLAESSPDWGSIAVAAGYYDQAHLIGEFRELVGLTPVAFAKRETLKRSRRRGAGAGRGARVDGAHPKAPG